MTTHYLTSAGGAASAFCPKDSARVILRSGYCAFISSSYILINGLVSQAAEMRPLHQQRKRPLFLVLFVVTCAAVYVHVLLPLLSLEGQLRSITEKTSKTLPFRLIDSIGNKVNITKKASEEQDSQVQGTCANLNELTKGSWNDETNQWLPSSCTFTPFVKSSLDSCLANKQISFYGDSTLKNIAGSLLISSNATNIEMSSWAGADVKYKCGGGTFGHNSRMAMWWTPSAFHQSPPSVGTMSEDDISVISISVWDMGTYYRGVNSWFTRMRNIIQRAANARNGRPLYILNLHRVYKSKCLLKHDTDEGRKNLKLCLNSKCDDLVFGFRDSIAAAVKCAQNNGYTNVQLVDTFGVTDSPYAEQRSDGVHFNGEVTDMEMQVLMSAICSGLEHANGTMDSVVCPATQSDVKFEEGRTIPCD